MENGSNSSLSPHGAGSELLLIFFPAWPRGGFISLEARTPPWLTCPSLRVHLAPNADGRVRCLPRQVSTLPQEGLDVEGEKSFLPGSLPCNVCIRQSSRILRRFRQELRNVGGILSPPSPPPLSGLLQGPAGVLLFPGPSRHVPLLDSELPGWRSRVVHGTQKVFNAFLLN